MANYSIEVVGDDYETFSASDRTIWRLVGGGHSAEDEEDEGLPLPGVRPGERIVCHVFKRQAFGGVLEIVRGPVADTGKMPLGGWAGVLGTVCFEVKVRVWLDRDDAIPIHNDELWRALSFTKSMPAGSKVHSRLLEKLAPFSDADTDLIEKALLEKERLIALSGPGDRPKRKPSPRKATNKARKVTELLARLESGEEDSPDGDIDEDDDDLPADEAPPESPCYFSQIITLKMLDAFAKSDKTVWRTECFRDSNYGIPIRPLLAGDTVVVFLGTPFDFVGVLRIRGGPIADEGQMTFADWDKHPTIVYPVEALAWLPRAKAIPIRNPGVWTSLSFTKNLPIDAHFPAHFYANGKWLADDDGKFLESLLVDAIEGKPIEDLPTTAKESASEIEAPREVTTPAMVAAAIRVEATPMPVDGDHVPPNEVRESIKVQAKLAMIGARWGMHIWVPRNDLAAIQKELSGENIVWLASLPLHYDEAILRTIRDIDVLWIKGRSIVRAFEVESTTSIFSGILRMADLLSEVPNLSIRPCVVAPESRRPKALSEISRPTFQDVGGKALSKQVKFLTFENVAKIASLEHLAHLQDSVLETYLESAPD